MPAAPPPPRRLDQCPPLQPVTVAAVDAAGEDALRLERLGVCPGRRVQLVRVGDPLILRVHGTRLGLSARLARLVTVTACSECLDPVGVGDVA